MSGLVLCLLGLLLVMAAPVQRTARHAPSGRPGRVSRVAHAARVRVGRRPVGTPDDRSAALALDLIAAVLSTGTSVAGAIRAVGVAAAEVGDSRLMPALQPLVRVGRLLDLGAEPEQAWSALAADPRFGPAAVAASRSAHSGARLAQSLGRSAAELRRRRLADTVARARRTGVWALLPLGCCFLPAFVCVGIVPVVIGISRGFLSARGG